MHMHVWKNEGEGKEACSEKGGKEIQKEEVSPRGSIFRGWLRDSC
jgi:hypothetical protein